MLKIGLLTPSFLPSCGTRQECWAARASVSSSCRQSWPCAPCDRVYGKTDQTNPVQRRERGMEDERKSRRMRGWNGCTHKEGKQWENDGGGGGRDAVVVETTTRVPVYWPLLKYLFYPNFHFWICALLEKKKKLNLPNKSQMVTYHLTLVTVDS